MKLPGFEVVSVRCTSCGAAPGAPCVVETGDGKRGPSAYHHVARHELHAKGPPPMTDGKRTHGDEAAGLVFLDGHGLPFVNLLGAVPALVCSPMALPLDESDRQLVILALARLAGERPGWRDALARIALRIDNRRADGEPETFEELRTLRTLEDPPEGQRGPS